MILNWIERQDYTRHSIADALYFCNRNAYADTLYRKNPYKYRKNQSVKINFALP